MSLHIYNHVREDALQLYGFKTRLEKDLFLMLISVSGIGPKLSINILSGIGPEDLLQAMAVGDAARIQAIPGVGKKTADRIALELRDRACKLLGLEELTEMPLPDARDKALMDDALSALLNLGYSAKSAKSSLDKALRRVEKPNLEGLIKEALRVLA